MAIADFRIDLDFCWDWRLALACGQRKSIIALRNFRTNVPQAYK